MNEDGGLESVGQPSAEVDSAVEQETNPTRVPDPGEQLTFLADESADATGEEMPPEGQAAEAAELDDAVAEADQEDAEAAPAEEPEAESDAEPEAETAGSAPAAEGDAPADELAQIAASLDSDAQTTGVPDGAAGEAAAGVADPAAPSKAEAFAAGFEAEARPQVPVWPFVAYLGLWLAFAGVVAWQLLELPVGVAAYEASVYPLIVYGGLALTLVGPLVILGTWLFARTRSDERKGLFSAVLLRGSIVTLIGVIVWWGALIAVDYVRLGRLF
jgi:hypothetical protein